MKIGALIDVHPNEPFGSDYRSVHEQNPHPKIKLIVGNQAAVTLGRLRFVDSEMSGAVPIPPDGPLEPLHKYESVRNGELVAELREDPCDVVIGWHNCVFQNGERAHMNMLDDGNGIIDKNLLAVAAFFGLWNVVVDNNELRQHIDTMMDIEVHAPWGDDAQKRRLELAQTWHQRLGELATYNLADLPAANSSDFTFYSHALDIPRAQAEALRLEQVPIARAFEELPVKTTRDLGLEPPAFALSWGDNYSPLINGQRSYFGQVVQLSFVGEFIG